MLIIYWRNAQWRKELEPYLDEAVLSLNQDQVPTPVENEFLASMLAWERAPILPISQWFTPELSLPSPDKYERGRTTHSVVGHYSQTV